MTDTDVSRTPTGSTDWESSPARAMMIAQVEQQRAAMAAADRAAADAAAAAAAAREAATVTPGVRQGNGSSVVFTLRLDPRELAALQRRAAAKGVRPSVFARNLIRIGVEPPRRGDDLRPALERLESALAAVRAVLAEH